MTRRGTGGFGRLAALLCLVLWCVSIPAGSAMAQGDDAIDLAAWEIDAARAENLIEAGRATTGFLENLRADLVVWRARLLEAQSANDARLATLSAQLEALGPPPPEGEAEPEAVAIRRAELQRDLNEAEAPRLAAISAYNRADGLIREIDTLLSERRADELLRLEPTPLNPVNWAGAMRDLSAAAQTQIAFAQQRMRLGGARQEMLDNAPIAIGLVVLGLVLVLRGRPWVTALIRRLGRDPDRRGRIGLSFLASLGQVALPLAGLLSLVAALVSSALLWEDATNLVLAVAALFLAVFVALWLGGRLFPVNPAMPSAFEIPLEARHSGRNAVLTIGIFVGLEAVMAEVVDLSEITSASRGVILLPVMLGLAYGFWRVSKILLHRDGVPATEPNAPAADAPAPAGFQIGLRRFLARALMAVAAIGPILALIGYLNAAQSMLVSTALTLAVVGILAALQPPIRDFYALFTGKTDTAVGEALVPVLINLVLALAALPLLALIWGMRPEQLGEVYTRFLEGVTLGETRITPGTMLAVALVFLLGLLATRALQSALRTTILPRTRLDTGAQNALNSGIGYVGIALAIIIAITAAGIDLTALGVVIGALSVGIGFGLQNVVSNFVSGIILLIERPISEGDWIEVNGQHGIVKDISVRSTRIETFDKSDLIVPNADLVSGTVTNWTRGNNIGRTVIHVGVAYGTDTRKVAEILSDIAANQDGVARYPPPGVDFLGFGADSLDFRIRAILRDVNEKLSITTEINHQIAERFAEQGIEIPFAQRDIWLRNPESLRLGGDLPTAMPEPGAASSADAATPDRIAPPAKDAP